MPRKKDDMRKMDESAQFLLRLPLGMLSLIQAEADREGVTTSEMFRRLIAQGLDGSSTTEQVFVRKGDRLVRLNVDRKKLERLIEQ
jgi:hypothetical protein